MRRRFFMFAAPAIVAAPSLMKVSALAIPKPAPLVFTVTAVTTVEEYTEVFLKPQMLSLASAIDRALGEELYRTSGISLRVGDTITLG